METEPTEENYHCNICNYTCLYQSHWKQHIESDKHKNNGIRKPRKDKKLDPQCKFCDYSTTSSTNMKLHYLESFHLMMNVEIQIEYNRSFISENRQ
jgi:hypothetical protein